MSTDIFYDRFIGPTIETGSNQTTTSLSVSSETAPTTVQALNYGNFVVQVSSPGSTPPATTATCTDTQGNTYTLIKEVQFAGYALDIFSRIYTVPNVATTITTTHQTSNHRIILSDEWYNLGNYEKLSSAYTSTATTTVDLGQFHVGQKHWLVYAVLALGGSPYTSSVSIPDNWSLLHDVGTNYADNNDVRLIIAYQIVNKGAKVNFSPVLGVASVWGGAFFSYKAKL